MTIHTEVGIFAITGEMKEHKQVIDEYSANGWRLAGVIPVQQTKEGLTLAFDLVFEKEAEY